MDKKPRFCGVLIHPVSFYGPHGIGCLGQEAREVLQALSSAGVNIWQILPLGPTGYGDSPYASRSTFAGNELLIDVRQIPYAKVSILDGCMRCDDGRVDGGRVDGGRVDYEAARRFKMPVLFNAADEFLRRCSSAELAEFEGFCADKSWWLDDYALYMSIADDLKDSRWFMWPGALAGRDKAAMDKCRRQYGTSIARYKVLQYYFFKQWDELHRFAAGLGMRILGDIPIFVAADSVDVWCNRRLFKLDSQGRPSELSGVPPDAFCADGQLWGNPVYDWEVHERDGFSWWRTRITETLRMVDMVRIDHFRGFESSWEIPSGSDNAINGKWVKGPGRRLFDKLPGDARIIAEDLGVITPEVESLRDELGLPGMKVLQFAFEAQDGRLNAAHDYLPHNYGYNCAAYTGTHDNETSRGWYQNQSDFMKDMIRRYLQCPDEDVVWQMMRSVLQSHAGYAIFPMQDVLGLGNEGRMNQPATVGASNWSWRLRKGELQEWMLARLGAMIALYGRDNKCNERKGASEPGAVLG